MQTNTNMNYVNINSAFTLLLFKMKCAQKILQNIVREIFKSRT